MAEIWVVFLFYLDFSVFLGIFKNSQHKNNDKELIFIGCFLLQRVYGGTERLRNLPKISGNK